MVCNKRFADCPTELLKIRCLYVLRVRLNLLTKKNHIYTRLLGKNSMIIEYLICNHLIYFICKNHDTATKLHTNCFVCPKIKLVMYNTPLFGNFSIANKLTCTSKCDVVREQYILYLHAYICTIVCNTFSSEWPIN